MIRKEIDGRRLTRSAVADLPGILQPDVSDLLRTKLARFGMNTLERLLNALDLENRIEVGSRSSHGAGRAGG